jgi:hypothetical protein
VNRDPAGEDTGELDLYAISCNDPINNCDDLGLMSYDDIFQISKKMNSVFKKITCCCTASGGISEKLNGTPFGAGNGAGVNVTATIATNKCVELYFVYWWDCYTAHQQAKDAGGIFNENNFLQYGWSSGENTYSVKAHPGMFAWTGAGDPYHLDIDSCMIFISCGSGHKGAVQVKAVDLLYTWNKRTKIWQ